MQGNIAPRVELKRTTAGFFYYFFIHRFIFSFFAEFYKK